MSKKILITEDEFIEANDIQLMLVKAGYSVCGIARSVDVALNMVTKERPDFVLVDIFLKGKRTGLDLAVELNKMNIPFIYISANSNEDILAIAKTTHPHGFIVKPFREKDLLVTMQIAEYRHDCDVDAQRKRELDLLQKMELANASDKDMNGKLLAMAIALQQHVPFDLLTIDINDTDDDIPANHSFLRIGFNEYQVLGNEELATVIRSKPLKAGISSNTNELTDGYYNAESFEELIQKWYIGRQLNETISIQSCLLQKLVTSTALTYRLFFFSRKPDAYNNGQATLLDRLQEPIAKNIEATLRQQVSEHQLKHENKVIPERRESAKPFDEIIGNSYVMVGVFDKITQVAPYDTSVLILGESGTGKERIADYIHRHSTRRDKPFVKINCAALPPTLIESELFGHEKGSFTGATDKRIGKFLQAHEGSIFLDEIGEMPIDMQAKLLRVLQEKEIEPIGGKSPVKVNVRIIAATNRNLEKEVAEGRFRLDLYYRLNVFPVQLPPLRERKEDIHSLALHFISLYNKRSGKKVEGVSDALLTKLTSYSWPGNIRELENLVERSVLMAKGTTIESMDLPHSLPQPAALPQHVQETQVKTIEEIERDHILNVLTKTNGKIWGTGGAAELLNIPPTTLSSKMKKLGIKKGFGL